MHLLSPSGRAPACIDVRASPHTRTRSLQRRIVVRDCVLAAPRANVQPEWNAAAGPRPWEGGREGGWGRRASMFVFVFDNQAVHHRPVAPLRALQASASARERQPLPTPKPVVRSAAANNTGGGAKRRGTASASRSIARHACGAVHDRPASHLPSDPAACLFRPLSDLPAAQLGHICRWACEAGGGGEGGGGGSAHLSTLATILDMAASRTSVAHLSRSSATWWHLETTWPASPPRVSR